MSFETRGGPAERPESDGDPRRPGDAPPLVSLTAGAEELVVAGVDVTAARAALAALGAQSSPDLARLTPEGTNALLAELQETAVAQVLDNPDLRSRDGEPFEESVLEKVRARASYRAARAAGEEDPVAEQLPELVQLVHEVQQDALNEARSLGAYDSRTIARAQTMLDAGAARGDVS